MNYPVWYLPETGGGFLIALIAIVHVFISHFAVGGCLYLVLTERKELRENSAEILAFTKCHAKFFMLVTMVFGGITGVGIWFIITLVQPAATSIVFMRDFVRRGYLQEYFSPEMLKVVPEYSPLILFLVTLLVGLGLIFWMLRMACTRCSD